MSPQDSLRALIDFSPLAIISVTREGRVSVWNPAAERLFGWQAAEVLGHLNPIVPAEAQAGYQHDLEALFSGATINGKEAMRCHKDGRRVEVCLWAAPIRNDEGVITGTTAILQDITLQKENERKLSASQARQERTEERLRQSEERLRLAFEASKIGYWDWNLITGEMVWSPIAKAQAGLAENSPATLDVLMNAVHSHDRQLMQHAIEDAVQNKSQYRLEFRVQWPDGSVHWRLASGRAFYDSAGRPTRMTGIAVDLDELKRAEASLELRAAALQAAANGIVITDSQGAILWANHAFSELTGYSCDEAVGLNPRVLKSGQHNQAFYAEMWQTITSGQIWRGELINRRKDGSLYAEEMTITPVRSHEGEITNFIAIKQDVSERKRAESALREAEAKYRSMFEDAAVGIYQCAPDGSTLRVNLALARLHGYDSPEEMLAAHPNIDGQLVNRQPGLVEEIMRTNDEVGPVTVELEVYCKSGAKKWISVTSRAVRNSAGQVQVYEGVVQDITDRKRAEEEVQFLAFYDSLTRLPNRSLFLDRAGIALASARRSRGKIALLFLDLDRFKNINDSLGHKIGDLLLREVAERLKSCVREEDTVARVGGDEYLVLLNPVSTGTAAMAVADRVRSSLCQGFVIQGHALSISCSVGISIYPDHATDTEALIKNADIAMYCAKERGRNVVRMFDQQMNTKLIEQITLENELHGALDRKEMSLVYQAQVKADTERIVGCEALLRWNHPELGPVPPDRFISVAENTGLIIPIGEWVLRTACLQAKQWEAEGLRLPVAVNVSGVQLGERGFLDLVKSILVEIQLAPELLELELTESVLVSNGEDGLRLLRGLTDLGVKLSIDDFGTGYSNLSYLKLFPIHKLKIAHSFVRDLAHDREDAAITEAIVAMAKALNLQSVAEAVETAEQISFLRACHCDVMQGFYFYRPLPPKEFAEVLREQVFGWQTLPTAVCCEQREVAAAGAERIAAYSLGSGEC